MPLDGAYPVCKARVGCATRTACRTQRCRVWLHVTSGERLLGSTGNTQPPRQFRFTFSTHAAALVGKQEDVRISSLAVCWRRAADLSHCC